MHDAFCRKIEGAKDQRAIKHQMDPLVVETLLQSRSDITKEVFPVETAASR